MNFHDAEILSSYLDGQVDPAEAARLEARLAVDAELRHLLDDLRVARGLLRQVPRRRAPRNFTLKPATARLRAPEPRAVPALSFASVVAAFVFIATLAVNGLAPIASRTLAAAPAPALGLGGGAGGGLGGGPPASAEAPMQSLAAAPPTGSPVPESTLAAAAPQDHAAATAQPPAAAAPKTAPPVPGSVEPLRTAPRPPVPEPWQAVLAIAALILGGSAWFLHLRGQRDFRRRWLRK